MWLHFSICLYHQLVENFFEIRLKNFLLAMICSSVSVFLSVSYKTSPGLRRALRQLEQRRGVKRIAPCGERVTQGLSSVVHAEGLQRGKWSTSRVEAECQVYGKPASIGDGQRSKACDWLWLQTSLTTELSLFLILGLWEGLCFPDKAGSQQCWGWLIVKH